MTKMDGRKALAMGALVTAGCVVAKHHGKKKLEKKKEQIQKEFAKHDFADSHAYFVGGGLASMAGAAYLIRDCRFKGTNIHIIEGMDENELKSLRGEQKQKGYICPGLASLQSEMSENFWDLFEQIPSLSGKDTSVARELLSYGKKHPIYNHARLIGHGGRILPSTELELDRTDRTLLTKLMAIPEEKLDDLTIADWFAEDPHFFNTNFWYIWRCAFAFQPESSLFEMRRSMGRMICELAKNEILAGLLPLPTTPNAAYLHPLRVYLEEQGVDFQAGTYAYDMDFDEQEELRVKTLHVRDKNKESSLFLGKSDLVFMTVGSMLEQASFGDMEHPAPVIKASHPVAELWKNVSAKADGLGAPQVFFTEQKGSLLESVTITCKGEKLIEALRTLSENRTDREMRMTFRDSAWLITCVVPQTPWFPNQQADEHIVWLYGLSTDQQGDYVRKTMAECSGKEILEELLYQMYRTEEKEEILQEVVDAIPCRMPYAGALHQPRKKQDRPHMVPEGSKNFAMIGQFVEVPKDMVFTEEYSVRSARTAVYKLTGHPETVCPVTSCKNKPGVFLRALKKLWLRR